MQNLENLDVFEILITQKLFKCPKGPFVRLTLICFSCSKSTFSLRRSFWVPTTYVLVLEKKNNKYYKVISGGLFKEIMYLILKHLQM